MALTYTWKIKSLKKQDNSSLDLNNIIFQTYWECQGTDEDGYAGTFHGATPFSLDQIDPDNFVPYENLTEADVLSWIQALVVDEYKNHVDEQINKLIYVQKNPPTEDSLNDLPWFNTPDEPVIEESQPIE